MDKKLHFSITIYIQIKIKKTITITVIKHESKYSSCQRVIPVAIAEPNLEVLPLTKIM